MKKSEKTEVRKPARVRTTVLVSSELHEFAKRMSLNLSDVLELALLRLYREHGNPRYTTKRAHMLIALYLAGDPGMKKLGSLFRDLGVYYPVII